MRRSAACGGTAAVASGKLLYDARCPCEGDVITSYSIHYTKLYEDPEIRKEYGVYDDAKLQAYVQRVGEKLAGLSHRPELFYRFTVLDSPEVNAFALPGGYVYITRGLMAYLNSEAELAAVLGHEIGHVTARHAVRQYTTAMAAQIGYTIGAIFVPQVGSQAGSTLFNVLGTALVRGYGREHELQADELGAEYSALAGYDPDAMLEVLQVLKNQEEFEVERAKLEGREPNVYHGVFATHPSNDQRLQQVVKGAQPNKARNPVITSYSIHYTKLYENTP